MVLRPISRSFPVVANRRSAYTLVEILVATTLTLILMTAVVTVFGGVGDGIAKARRAIEQNDRLRTAMQQFRVDLSGVTVKLDGQRVRPEENQGYFELIASGNAQVSPLTSSDPVAVDGNRDKTRPDCNIGERGNILMFTTRNAARPFVGRYGLSATATNPTIQSDVAEVAWFLRGTTLHRRVLLVVPGTAIPIQNYYQQTKHGSEISQFYVYNDISVHMSTDGRKLPTPNSLGDLTKRENRFAHPFGSAVTDRFPFDARQWGLLGLPTLAECTSPTWMQSWMSGSVPSPLMAGKPIPFNLTLSNNGMIDMWNDVPANDDIYVKKILPDQFFANDGKRVADDVVLTNVIAFEVRAWDPGAPVRSFIDQASGQPVIVKPGELRYQEAIQHGNDPKYQQYIVSYGAYVDLGWRAYDPYYPNQNFSSKDAQITPNGAAPACKFFDYDVYNPANVPDKSLLRATFDTQNRVMLDQNGSVASRLAPKFPQRVYDTGCWSYENEGIYYYDPSQSPGKQVVLYNPFSGDDPPKGNRTYASMNLSAPFYPMGLGQWLPGTATNGVDDFDDKPNKNPQGYGVVDDEYEWITNSPYPTSLRGIQITVRCFEPDSRQIREVTIEHDFLPK